MKYSKKVREEAAFIASVGAMSGHDGLGHAIESGSKDAVNLFWAAWRCANRARREPGNHLADVISCFDPIIDAEAEALIRTGWTP